MAEYATTIEIDAPPDAVFTYLTTEAGMTSWIGQHAKLDAREGGVFAVDIAGYPVRGHYLVVERPVRVVVSWGFAGSDDLPPGASQVEFTLTPIGNRTRVDLVHRALPEAAVSGHAHGWAHFLPRLALAATGTQPGPDSWQPLP